ncbi:MULTISPECIES: recombinase family protein [Rhodomicrobium]|uniref:recombinase family protein n=1 Tax=Rhodomicrobium TaxID=1068 RepID=UPI000B4C088D|nr:MULTISPECIES: recombinase family protein [Rhodomicrobium]
MHAAIYARFSSDLQDARSLTDQISLAKNYASARQLPVVSIYEDAALSGATIINRPGMQQLLEDAAAGRFDLLITESIDRLSRGQADIAWLYERLTFFGVRIETLADGQISEIHIGLKGTMAALFLKDLAQKTRRGQIGRVKAGRIPGGKSYGYDVVRAGGERGERTINENEAAIVRGIYRDYAAGKSPLAIVSELNQEGIPGPSGGRWNASALLGSRKRRNGILNNELYRGVIVYNRQRFVKDPTTGKRLARENPESEWHRQDVPELRIVDDTVWNKVHAVRGARGGPHLYQRRRPKRLLSGLLRCAECGGSFSVVKDERMRCSTLTNSRGCSNTRTVKVSEVEERVLAALQNYLLAPEMVAAAVQAYREERRRISEDRRKRRHVLLKDATAVERQLDFLMKMVGEGATDLEKSRQRYIELTAEQSRIAEELADAGNPDAIEFHPEAAELYRAKVADIHNVLKNSEAACREAIVVVRDLIDHILVTPAEKPTPVGLTVVGNLAALLSENPSGTRVAESLVAGAGFEPATFRL